MKPQCESAERQLATLPYKDLFRVFRLLPEGDARAHLSCVSKQWYALVVQLRKDELVNDARRPGRWTAEKLPTVHELFGRGCTEPDAGKILKFARAHCGFNEAKGALCTFYKQTEEFQAKVQAYEKAERLQVIGYRTLIGDGVNGVDKGFSYVGDLENGKPHGFGYLQASDRSSHYRGGFKEGQKHGRGENFFSGRELYIGGYQYGKRAGQGFAWQIDTQFFYEGFFVDNQFFGPGLVSCLREKKIYEYKDLKQTGIARFSCGVYFACSSPRKPLGKLLGFWSNQIATSYCLSSQSPHFSGKFLSLPKREKKESSLETLVCSKREAEEVASIVAFCKTRHFLAVQTAFCVPL